MLLDLPSQVHERVACSIAAAEKYEIPANILLAVAEKESGKPGLWVRNTNGTYDVGQLQFNTGYLVQLARYGIKPADVAVAGCYPYDLAAWRLRQHITKDQGDLWTRSANFHSRTPRLNESYRADLLKRAARWADWLAARYPTHEVTVPDTVMSRSPASDRSTAVAHAAPNQLTNLMSIGYVPRRLLIEGRP